MKFFQEKSKCKSNTQKWEQTRVTGGVRGVSWAKARAKRWEKLFGKRLRGCGEIFWQFSIERVDKIEVGLKDRSSLGPNLRLSACQGSILEQRFHASFEEFAFQKVWGRSIQNIRKASIWKWVWPVSGFRSRFRSFWTFGFNSGPKRMFSALTKHSRRLSFSRKRLLLWLPNPKPVSLSM